MGNQLDLEDRFELKHAVSLLKLLSGFTRLEILARLAEAPKAVGAVADELRYDIATVSRQLQDLKAHHAVDVKRHKHEHVYYLNGSVRVTALKHELEICMVEAHGCRVTVNIPGRVQPK